LFSDTLIFLDLDFSFLLISVVTCSSDDEDVVKKEGARWNSVM
jgi:hypothetical protein